ncbi:hypothetical protein TWF696_007999 [Orbilia brochopaga]|uniref:Uncharacterized protein n=1 Tax=Orbilia brochopaga TaxID=3140254 RepID=A0AAV9UMR6_9PEZI
MAGSEDAFSPTRTGSAIGPRWSLYVHKEALILVWPPFTYPNIRAVLRTVFIQDSLYCEGIRGVKPTPHDGASQCFFEFPAFGLCGFYRHLLSLGFSILDLVFNA